MWTNIYCQRTNCIDDRKSKSPQHSIFGTMLVSWEMIKHYAEKNVEKCCLSSAAIYPHLMDLNPPSRRYYTTTQLAFISV